MNAAAIKSDAGFLAAGSERNLGTRGRSLRDAWSDYAAYRATLAELRDLTDRQLADVGATRATLRTFARRAVYGN
jgi:uncharacterized protein YjiS (DUF1127 family)